MRRGIQIIAREIKENVKSGIPYHLIFAPVKGLEDKEKLEAHLKERFELWANTWIIPLADEIIAKVEPVERIK